MFMLDFSLPIYHPTLSLYLGFALARFGLDLKTPLSQFPFLARSPKAVSVLADFIGLLLTQCLFGVLALLSSPGSVAGANSGRRPESP